MHNQRYFIEAETCQESKANQKVCGDACSSRKIKEEDRLITVLSDGLGSGVKANVLATMTTSMALQFTSKNDPLERTAAFIMHTLPIDPKRQISYSTFTILDINCLGETKVVEYDNPALLIFRDGDFFEPAKTKQVLNGPDERNANVYYSSFTLQKEDRIIMVSDGITQSGIGSARFPFGWETEGLKGYIKQTLTQNPNISAHQLARKIVYRAQSNDAGSFRDDATCHVLYCREPRRLMIATGPPFHENCDGLLAERVANFEGKKIICGGTTSKIISRELKRHIEVDINNLDPLLPPTASMEGIDLITEGILTLGKAVSILEQMHSTEIKGNSPADKMVKLLLSSDEIILLAGTKVNNAHQDPNLPVELEIRRNVVKKIASLLEEKFLKKIEIEYL